MVGAPIVYGVYYPQPYLTQILRKLPIAVVDSDLSEISRRIVETLDASGPVQVAVRADTLADARGALDRGGGHPPPDATRRPQGRHRASSDLCGCHLPVRFQIDSERHRHRHRHVVL